MSPLRRVLLVLGLLLLLASLCFLVVANLPSERLQDRQPLSPAEMTLPTPQALEAGPQFAFAALATPGWGA